MCQIPEFLSSQAGVIEKKSIEEVLLREVGV